MSLIENQSKLVERLASSIGKENVISAKNPRERRTFIEINADSLRDAVTYLKEKEDFEHISTITGLDTGQDLELIYHLTKRDLILNLKLRVPYERPVVKSISDILNGAILYEREVHDLIGVIPEGHPNLKPRGPPRALAGGRLSPAEEVGP